MSSLFNNLLGNGGKDRGTPEEMRAVLREMREERARFEALFENADASANRLRLLGEPITKVENDVKGLVARLADLEKGLEKANRATREVDLLGQRAAELAQAQGEAEARIGTALEEAQKIRGAFDEIREKVTAAIDLRERLEGFLEIDKPFQVLRGEAEAVRAQVDGAGDQLGRLREQQDRLADAHKLSTTKMEALDRRREEFSRDLSDKERRVAGVEGSLRGMDAIPQTVSDLKREMGALKALGDTVAQKTAALEAQREVVERALGRADQLEQAMRQIDAGVRQQQANEKSLAAMTDQVGELRSLHESVLDRAREITELQREADESSHTARQELTRMRDEMKGTIDRFDFEGRGLESVSQRVADLRADLSDFENRFKRLAESSQTVRELDARTGNLAAQLVTFAEEFARVDGEVAKLHGLGRDVETGRQASESLLVQVGKLESLRPGIESALGDAQQLGSTHARVREALELSQQAHAEITRMRASQAEAREWLAGLERTMNEVRRQAAEVHQLAPAIDVARQQTQRVQDALASIEERRGFTEQLQSRLTEMATDAGNLDERGRDLMARMEAAEQRFVGLSSHAEEADALAGTIAEVTRGVRAAEQKTNAIRDSVREISERSKSVEALAESSEHLRAEIEQRHGAVTEAAAKLTEASALRQAAAEAVQQLSEQQHQLGASAKAAERQASKVDQLSAQLEDRAAKLQTVDRRIARFEERLGKWDRIEEQVSRSLEQIVARQSTVESLRSDLERMFSMAEKTAQDVRAITSAHQEIEESRTLLEEVLRQVQEVHDSASALDERRRQMDRAEERLARADALLVDVRSSLEALEGQKAIVDQAVEKTGSLQFLLKQAEATMDGLREERKLNVRVQNAMAVVRQQEDEDEGLADAA